VGHHGELKFRETTSSGYASQFADADGYFFVLEPPHPPAPPPDMDAIPVELDARNAAAEPDGFPPQSPVAGLAPPDGSVPARFRLSMEIDYEKWHDGVGYDVDLLAHAGPQDRQAIEDLLIARQCRDWRDVEALTALGSSNARAVRLGSPSVLPSLQHR